MLAILGGYDIIYSMVKTDKKVVKKPAVKKTAKKTTKKTVAKKVVRKTKTKKANTDYFMLLEQGNYLHSFLKDMMPQMIKQLDAGVSTERIVEMTAFSKGDIDFGSGTASFKFGGKKYSVTKTNDFWKLA